MTFASYSERLGVRAPDCGFITCIFEIYFFAHAVHYLIDMLMYT